MSPLEKYTFVSECASILPPVNYSHSFFFIAVAKNKHKDSHLPEQQKRDKNKQLFLEVLFHYK